MTNFKEEFTNIGMDFIELLGDLKDSLSKDLYDYTVEFTNLHLLEEQNRKATKLQELETRLGELEEEQKELLADQRQALFNLRARADQKPTPRMLRHQARQTEKKGKRTKGKRV